MAHPKGWIRPSVDPTHMRISFDNYVGGELVDSLLPELEGTCRIFDGTAFYVTLF